MIQQKAFEDQLRQEMTSYDQEGYLVQYNMNIIREMLNSQFKEQFYNNNSVRKNPSDALRSLQVKQSTYQHKQIIKQQSQQQDYEKMGNQMIQKRPKQEFKTISYSVPRFEKLGTNSRGVPLYRMSDVYLPTNPQLMNLYQEKLRKESKIETQSRFRQYKQQNLQRILQNWINKQNEQFYERGKQQMNVQQLEEIVADMGQRKENFFLYYKNYPQPNQAYFNIGQINNPYLLSNDFVPNFRKTVSRIRQQFQQVEQFQSDQQQYIQFDWLKKKGSVSISLEQRKQTKLWGQMQTTKKVKKNSQDKKLFTIQDDLKSGSNYNSLSNQILKQMSYINAEIVKGKHLLPIQQLQKLQIDLNNNNFFSKIIHHGVMKRNEEVDQTTSFKNRQAQKTVQDRVTKVQQSVLSRSDNPTLISSKPVNNQPQNFMKSQILNQTIESLIAEKLRIQKKSGVKHSDVANRLLFTKFRLQPKQFQHFHRNNFPFLQKLYLQTPISIIRSKPNKQHSDYLQLNTEKQESFIKFPNPKSLCLSSGDFIAIQNIQQSPLLISNIGMCSKLLLQINSQNVLNTMSTENFLKRDFEDLEHQRERQAFSNNPQTLPQICSNWRKVITDNLGSNGKIFIGDNQSLLIGTPDGLGVAVLQSNLSSMPIVKQKSNNRDFILVKQGNNWFLRRPDNIYTSGQVQPKMQVFSPDSRNINNFLTNYFKSYAKKFFNQQQAVSIDHLRQIFPNMNQHIMRKNLKELGARSTDNRVFTGPDQTSQFDITPQQICQYQKMQNSLFNLQTQGISQLRTPDKMKQIISAYFKRNPNDLKKFAIARLIYHELQLTSWYLTQSFLNAEQGHAKMELYGFGDPTNNHGGYSYIKKPQKQRMQKDDQFHDKKQQRKVSGTEADLRKLKAPQIIRLLQQRGVKQEVYSSLKRWRRIDLLKKIGTGQYVRQERQTKRMRRQSQKRQISAIFNKMLRNLNGIGVTIQKPVNGVAFVTTVGPPIHNNKFLNNSEQKTIQEVHLNEYQYYQLQHYMKSQQILWQNKRKKLAKYRSQNNQEYPGQGQEQDDDGDNENENYDNDNKNDNDNYDNDNENDNDNDNDNDDNDNENDNDNDNYNDNDDNNQNDQNYNDKEIYNE